MELVNWRRKAHEIYAWEVNAIDAALGAEGILEQIRSNWVVFKELYCQVSTQRLRVGGAAVLPLETDTPGGPSDPPPGYDLFVRFSTEFHPYGDSFRFYILVRYPDDSAPWSVAWESPSWASRVFIDRANHNDGRSNIVFDNPFDGHRTTAVFGNGRYSVPG